MSIVATPTDSGQHQLEVREKSLQCYTGVLEAESNTSHLNDSAMHRWPRDSTSNTLHRDGKRLYLAGSMG